MERPEHETTRAISRRRSDRHVPDERPYLIGVAGEHAGRVLPLEGLKELNLGRQQDCEVAILLDPDVSRRHAKLTFDNAGRAWITDLKSKNGTLVNGKDLLGCGQLQRGDRIFLGDSTIFKIDWLTDEEMKSWQAASVDALTECFNRSFFDARVEEMFGLARDRGAPLGLVLLDVDHFKRINDTRGHQAGDHALQQIASAIQTESERPGVEGMAFRYGGEEFCVLLPGHDLARARAVAETMRNAVERLRLEFEGEPITATISAGVASTSEKQHESVAAFVRAADENLYRAKNEGRNRVV